MLTLSTSQDKTRQLYYLAATASSLDAMRGNVQMYRILFVGYFFFLTDK